MDTLLLRYIAQATVDMRWLAALKYTDERGQLPEGLDRFGYVTFAGLDETVEETADESTAVDEARAVAAELMAIS